MGNLDQNNDFYHVCQQRIVCQSDEKGKFLRLFRINTNNKLCFKNEITHRFSSSNIFRFACFLRNPAIKQMEEKVLHGGIVQEVSEKKITVVIVNASACSSCHANGACLASDMKEKEIEIYRFSGNYYPGQHVNVVGRTSQGYKAAFYGYLLPFILVFATLILGVSLTKNEAFAGLLSLAILIPYYAVLYFFRNKIKRSFEFEISAIN